MTPTLYLTRNGLLEPLGQSQVLSYLRGLSRQHRITLITYEKDKDWADTARVVKLRMECERLGIRWLPQRFRHPERACRASARPPGPGGPRQVPVRPIRGLSHTRGEPFSGLSSGYLLSSSAQ